MKRIYVCHKSIENETEKKEVIAFCKYIKDMGNLPLAPSIHFLHFIADEKEDRGFYKTAKLSILASCSELWYFGDTITTSMTDEICFAMEKGKRVLYITKETFEKYLEKTEVHHEKNA